jgi:hypothetical protein
MECNAFVRFAGSLAKSELSYPSWNDVCWNDVSRCGENLGTRNHNSGL